ncbi:MAG: YcxB family protein [Clostridia bacterium]|nr:YcxB family protein [Clostridia bacterium]MBO5786884.1 YcxB family protein [Clostridia bacterium]
MKLKPLSSEGYVTPKDYSAYIKFNMLKGRYYRIKVIAIRFVLAVAALTLLWLGFVYQNKAMWIAAGSILLCFLMFFYTINTNVKRICNKSAKVIRAKQRVQFGKNGFVFELLFQNEEENEYNEIFYDEVETVYLAPNAMYIYIEKRSVIVVPKRNINISPIEARAFLEKFVPAQKLVVCV